MSSAAYEPGTSVEREAVVSLPPRRVPTVVPDPTPASASAPPPVQSTIQPMAVAVPPRSDRAFVGVLGALASLLAARLLLLLSVTFGFVLAIMAVRSDSYLGLSIVGTFCGLTILPLVWLDIVVHRRGGQ